MGKKSAPENEFAQYVAFDCECDCNALLDRIHKQYYHGKGPNTAVGGRADKEISFEISEFEWLCKELAAMEVLESVTGKELVAQNRCPGKVRLFLRHDVDGDIETAVRIAEIEAKHGLKGTFYLLPAAIYYSDWYWVRSKGHRPFASAVINRYKNMIPVYRRIQSLGHEIGLHYFPFGAYREKGMDGVAHMVKEAAWLRAHGLEIYGGVGHSSAKAQGADSAEIFVEFKEPNRNANCEATFASLAENFVFDGVTLPRFRCSFSVIPLDYVLEFHPDSTGYWAVQANGLARYTPLFDVARRRDCMALEGLVADVKRRLTEREGGLNNVTLMIHPVHFRARMHPARSQEDEERLQLAKQWAETIEVPPEKRKRSVPCVYEYRADNGTEIQIAHFVNSEGFLDFEPDIDADSRRMKIWIIGGSLMESTHLQISNGLGGWLKKLYWIEDKRRICVRNIAAKRLTMGYALDIIRNGDIDREVDALVLEVSRDTVGRYRERKVFEQLVEYVASIGVAVVLVAVDLRFFDKIFVGKICRKIIKSSVRTLKVLSLREAYERTRPIRLRNRPDSQNWLEIGRSIKDGIGEVLVGAAGKNVASNSGSTRA